MAAGTTSKRPKATAVNQASIEDTNTFLQSLPEKPKENLSLREAVEQMRDSVKAALAKGYSYQELAAMLTEKGIKISAFTLKNYVPSGRRRSTKEQPPEKPVARRGRKPKADAEPSPVSISDLEEPDDEADSLVTTADTPEPTEASLKVAEEAIKSAPAKGGRGRGNSTSAAKAATASESTVKQTPARRGRTATTRQADAANPSSSTTKSTSTRGRKKA